MQSGTLLAGLAICLTAAGCDRAINSLTDTPELRKGVVDKARSSCVASANNAVKMEKTPAVEAQIVTYCDCVADQGMGKFSNAELVHMGMKGAANLTPDQAAKMDGVVKMCQAQAFHQ